MAKANVESDLYFPENPGHPGRNDAVASHMARPQFESLRVLRAGSTDLLNGERHFAKLIFLKKYCIIYIEKIKKI